MAKNLITDFSAAVEANTCRRMETLGWLCGEEVSPFKYCQ